MATANPTVRDVAPIKRQLRRLRRGLLQWIVIEGLGRILLAGLAIAVADMFLDRVFRMDFAQRAIMLVLMAAGILAVMYRLLFRPLERKPNDDSLALEVERRHRAFDESVISSLQFARDAAWRQSGVSPDLVQATIDRGVREAQSIDFTDVLDRRRFTRNALLLAAGLIGWLALAWGVTSHDFLKTWFDRNVMLGDSQWPQATYLEIEGLQNGELIVDRGANLELNVMVSERSRVTDVDVDIEFESNDKRTLQETNPTGRFDGRQRQWIVHNVNSEFRLRALGGDAATEWVPVRLVEPLDLTELTLIAHLPEYVGGAQRLEGGGPHTVLAQSTLEVQATANLPIARMQLRFTPASAPAPGAAPPPVAETNPPAGDAAANTISKVPTADVVLLEAMNDTQFRGNLSAGDGSSEESTLSSGKYAVEMFDAVGRRNLRPIAFELAVVADKPPKVAASLSGISGLVVPKATIPLSWKVSDQFGLTQASIPYQWRTPDELNELRQGELQTWTLARDQLTYGATEQEFSYATEAGLDLRPLQLPSGIVLRFQVSARDNQPDASRGTGQSREFLLRVVTEEELRADLLRREVEQRALFQQNRDNQLQLLTELRACAAALAAEPDRDLADRQRQILELRNRQKNIGTNLYQIAERFADFLAEANNNRLDESETELQQEIQDQTPSLVSFKVRYSQRIIDPLRSLDETEIYVATQGLEEARNQLGDAARFAETANQTAELQETIVRKMDDILAAMEESQTYQEIVNRVIALKRLEQSLLESIQRQRRSGEQSDIFD